MPDHTGVWSDVGSWDWASFQGQHGTWSDTGVWGQASVRPDPVMWGKGSMWSDLGMQCWTSVLDRTHELAQNADPACDPAC